VHRAHEKVAGTISCENAPGAIGPVRGWRQPEHEDACEGITEAGDWPSPVRVVSMCGLLFPGDLFAIRT